MEKHYVTGTILIFIVFDCCFLIQVSRMLVQIGRQFILWMLPHVKNWMMLFFELNFHHYVGQQIIVVYSMQHMRVHLRMTPTVLQQMIKRIR